MKEWYLMNNHKPNTVSGYEGDILTDFAQSNFNDVLETTFSDTVLLYNSSMTECQEINCVIQGNSADTQLTSIERKILFPIGLVNTGMYLYFGNAWWIIAGFPSANKIYDKVVVYMCQYKLCWQNKKGEIIERWVHIDDYTKYSSGIIGNTNLSSNHITIKDNQYGVIMPVDTETKSLKRSQRFVVDFYDIDVPEVYAITNRKMALSNNESSGRGGVIEITLSIDVYNPDADLKISNGNGEDVWVCDYIQNKTNTDLSGYIKSDFDCIYIGLKPTVFTAHVESGDADIKWEIDCDFVDKLHIVQDRKLISISTDNDNLINKVFKLTLNCDGHELESKDIVVKAFF